MSAALQGPLEGGPVVRDQDHERLAGRGVHGDELGLEVHRPGAHQGRVFAQAQARRPGALGNDVRLLDSKQVASFVARGFLRFDEIVPQPLCAEALAEIAAGTRPSSYQAKRGEDRSHLWGVIGQGDEPRPDTTEPVVEAVLAFVGSTPCDIAIVPVEDVLGLIEQPNIPGTIDEHPNWRQRLPVALDKIAAKVDLKALKAATRERSLTGGR